MHDALGVALMSATIALDVGAFTDESLKSGPRAGLEQRKATLGSSLRPCHADRIIHIYASLGGMPARGEDDPAKAQFLFKQDVADLSDAGVPEFALDAAARAFRQGSVAGRAGPFRPTVAELITEAHKFAAPWHAEYAKIKRVIAAASAPKAIAAPSGGRPVSPDAWAALKSSIGNLGRAS